VGLQTTRATFRGEGAFPNPGPYAVTVGRELRCALATPFPDYRVAGCIARPAKIMVRGANGRSQWQCGTKPWLLEVEQI
jgi:hypothetical protein